MKRTFPTERYASTQLVNIAIIVLMSVGGIGVIETGFSFRQAFSSSHPTQIVRDTSRYQEIRHKLWLNQNQVRHFPDYIYADASNIYLAYSRGVSHGSNFFQVRFKLPEAQLRKLNEQYQVIAKRKYVGGNANARANLAHDVPTTFFYTGSSQEDIFPSSYEILVLGANNRGISNFKWNHGDSYGVAIDKSASEIVYWVEEW